MTDNLRRIVREELIAARMLEAADSVVLLRRLRQGVKTMLNALDAIPSAEPPYTSSIEFRACCPNCGSPVLFSRKDPASPIEGACAECAYDIRGT